MKQQHVKMRKPEFRRDVELFWFNDPRRAPRKLFHFFHAAQLLRKDSQLLRLAATHPGALHDGLSRLVTLTSHEATLRSALDGELDREAPERIIHVAASIGNMQVLRLALQAGQHINSFSAKGETPAMLAAAAGHAETLRYLLRNQADVARKSRAGFTALEYAARNGHPEVVRLLRDPFSRLAWRKKGRQLPQPVRCHDCWPLDQKHVVSTCRTKKHAPRPIQTLSIHFPSPAQNLVVSPLSILHSTNPPRFRRGFGDAAVIGATRRDESCGDCLPKKSSCSWSWSWWRVGIQMDRLKLWCFSSGYIIFGFFNLDFIHFLGESLTWKFTPNLIMKIMKVLGEGRKLPIRNQEAIIPTIMRLNE